MLSVREKYITDENGKRTAVVIDIEDYKKIKKIIEEYDGYDTRNINEDIAIALKEVEQGQVKPIHELFGDLK